MSEHTRAGSEVPCATEHLRVKEERDELLEAAKHAESELWGQSENADSYETRVYFAQVALVLKQAIDKAEGKA